MNRLGVFVNRLGVFANRLGVFSVRSVSQLPEQPDGALANSLSKSLEASAFVLRSELRLKL